MPPRVACKCCNQVCEGHLMVTCSVCKNKYKHSCVDITANEVRTLNSNKGYDWTCIDCRSIGKDLKDLKALIIKLQNDIKELRDEKVSTANSQGMEFEEIISELCERQKRKNNIMIYNVLEPNKQISASERMQTDKNTVSEILSTISPELSVTNIKLFRVGAYSDSKKRPIKVVLENDDITRKVLKNSKLIKSKPNLKNINLSADRTKRQTEYYKKVKQELLDRINSGDNNCKIKYFNDIPRVVSLNGLSPTV